MRKALPGNLLLFCTLLLAGRINAQPKSTDSSLVYTSFENAIGLHNASLGENIHLYNGPEDPGYNHLAIGNPYFIADSVQIGSVFYDDTYYKGVSMLYDIVQDDVVILQYSLDKENFTEEYKKITRQDLVKNKVSWFTLPGHEFVRLPADSSSAGMPGGFYDRLYNGKVKLFVKRTKIYVEEVKGQALERRYEQSNAYYIFKNGKYYTVRSKKSLSPIFNDKKKEINSLVRSNRKKYKRNKDLLFFETTRYYDQLTTK